MKLSSFLKVIIYSSLAIVPLLAWYVSDQTFFPYVTGKNFAFRFLVEISMLAWVILAVIDKNYRPKKSVVFYTYSIFLFIMFLANVFGANPYHSFFSNFERMEGWFTHLHLFMYFIILYSVFKTDQDWRKIFGWFVVGNIGVSLQALIQLFGQKDFFLTKYYTETITQIINSVYPITMGGGFRLDSTLGNSAYYGIYTLFFVFLFIKFAILNNKWEGSQGFRHFFAVFLAAFLIILERFIKIFGVNFSNQTYLDIANFIWLLGVVSFIIFGINFVRQYVSNNIGSYVFLLMAVINFILLYYTQTRGSYLGLIGGVIVAIYSVVFVKILSKIKDKFKKYLVGIFLTLFTFIFVPLLLVSSIQSLKNNPIVEQSLFLKRLTTINIPSFEQAVYSIKNGNYQEMLNTFGEITIVSRILNAKMSIEGISKDLKTFLLGYGQENYFIVFSQNYDPRMYAQEPWFDRAHNVFFDWLTSGGVLGLVVYLALYLTPIYMLWMYKGRDNIQLIERALLTGLLVAYFIHNLFVFDNIMSLILFVTVLAYISARMRGPDNVIFHENKYKKFDFLQKNILIFVGGILSIYLMVNTVVKPLLANLELMRVMYVSRNLKHYEQVPDVLSNVFKSTKSAINLNTFANNEIVEQSLSIVLLFSQLDYNNIPEVNREVVKNTLLEYKKLLEDTAYGFVWERPNARILTIMSNYNKALGNLKEAERLAEMAFKQAPNKHGVVFEYVDILISLNKKDEAYELIKELFYKEKTFIESEERYITVAAKAGKKDEAKNQLEDLRKRNKEVAERLDASLVTLLK